MPSSAAPEPRLMQPGPDRFHDTRAMLAGFSTPLWLPRLRSATVGAWHTSAIAMFAPLRGYWGHNYTVSGTVLLNGPSNGGSTTWMSLTPFEVESQEIGIAAASGHTVVLGLGMGWQAANVALRDEVTKVTVIERDPEIVALAQEIGVFEQLPPGARGKIEIVIHDAATWRPTERVDVLLVDIWEQTSAPNRIEEYRLLHEHIGARKAYFWGQEIQLWMYARQQQRVPDPNLDWPTTRALIAEHVRVPLILPDWPNYPERIAQAAQWWAPSDSN